MCLKIETVNSGVEVLKFSVLSNETPTNVALDLLIVV